MDHSQLWGVRGPLMMILPLLRMFLFYLENISTQSSSHNCPIEISVPVCSEVIMWPWVATLDSSGAIGKLTLVVEVNSPPLAVPELGPSLGMSGIAHVHAGAEA